MNPLDKRWALAAQDLQLNQLDGARRLAESWRTGLSGLTSLFAAVTIVSGPNNLGGLTTGSRMIVAIIIGLAFAAFVTATLLAVRAASGAPERIRLDGETLKAWTLAEVRRVRILLNRAVGAMLAGLLLVASSVALTWFAPAEDTDANIVEVLTERTRLCGELIRVDGERLLIDVAGTDHPLVVLMDTVESLTPSHCSTD